MIFVQTTTRILRHNRRYENGLERCQPVLRQGMHKSLSLIFCLDLPELAAMSCHRFRHASRQPTVSFEQILEVPDFLNWTAKGCVTPIDGPCGSCWSFSATGSREDEQAALAEAPHGEGTALRVNNTCQIALEATFPNV